ncbi:MAG TPA: hypothetical protein QGF41_09040 [Gammaproteobacteria bacterium]|jgi:hypothetical protein|nr:hypothetical protein [Gammaproteobacteria bacterium]|tara:strand:+ start:370 stop:504 length:135 start_codon:yes stop_codon:yes gene_type:complete
MPTSEQKIRVYTLMARLWAFEELVKLPLARNIVADRTGSISDHP